MRAGRLTRDNSKGKGVRLPNDLLARVEHLCMATGLTWSQIVREGVARLVDESERQGAVILRADGRVRAIEIEQGQQERTE